MQFSTRTSCLGVNGNADWGRGCRIPNTEGEKSSTTFADNVEIERSVPPLFSFLFGCVFVWVILFSPEVVLVFLLNNRRYSYMGTIITGSCDRV